jgi:CRP-like cAMP-binding protein
MVDLNLLRQYVPMASLSPSDRSEIARNSRLGNYQPGQVIFNRGEVAKTVVYLTSGEVELFDGKGSRVVSGDSPEARHPLGQGAKRATTATCLKPAQVLFIDRDRLDLVLTWSQSSTVEVTDLAHDGPHDNEEGEGDWMTALLQSQMLQRVPPGNIGQLFAAFRPVEFAAGETIIRQGDPGDCYYVVSQGRCEVIQHDAIGFNEREVARLGVGRGFGEEALVSGNPRNATVRAVTPVLLMRLAKADFERLLKAPLLKEIHVDAIPNDAQLVDVRLPEEFEQGRLPDAINLPLPQIREMMTTLDPSRVYVVYCDSGRRSASATYLLCERGFDARLIAGGVPADEMPIRG